jgi:hypothetical protein
MKKLLLALLLLYPAAALAQSAPNLYQGFVPSAAQWMQYFAGKWDYPGYTALNKGGDNMQGLLGIAPSLIASLPTCVATLAGELAYVTNGVASPSYNATVSTTGSSNQLVWCNGTNWTYH